MKFIFLLKSIISDWFTVHIKYTVVVLATMVLSVLAMFFISTKVASEKLEDTYKLNWYSANYSVSLSDSGYCSPCKYVTKELLDRYLEADLPPLYRYWHNELDDFYDCTVTYTKKNGKPLANSSFGLTFSFSQFDAMLAFDETQKKYEDLIQTEYEFDIVSGRYFTEEELQSHKPVIIAPGDSGLKVGDFIECAGYQLEVIGIARRAYGTWYGEDYGIVPFWLADECIHNYQGQRDLEAIDDSSVVFVLPDFDIGVRLTYLTYEHPLTFFERQRLVKALDVDYDELFLGYEDELDYQMNTYKMLALAQCGVFGVFCVITIVFVMWCLCEKNIHTMRIFRLYGATSIQIVAVIFSLIMILSFIAAAVSFLICPTTLKLYQSINNVYQWRFSNYFIAIIIMFLANIIAAIPSVIITLKKAPAKK